MQPKRKRSASDVASTPTLDHVLDNIPNVGAHNRAHASFRDLMPNSPQSVAFLYGPRFFDVMNEAATASNVAASFNVTCAQAVEELRRLLALKIFIHDDKAEKLSPSQLMQTMWQAAILDTQFHLELQASLPFFIHHRPSGASATEAEAHRVRLITMESLYNRFFGTNPLGSTNQPRENPLQEADIDSEDSGSDHPAALETSRDYSADDDLSLICEDPDNGSDYEADENAQQIGSIKPAREILLHVRSHISCLEQSYGDFNYSMNPKSTFQHLLTTIAERYSLSPRHTYHISCEGERLSPQDTPAFHGMQDLDIVDILEVHAVHEVHEEEFWWN